MRTNEGFVDRVVHVTLGAVLMSLLTFGPVPGWGLVGLVGLIPLVTGLAAFCPTYVLVGIDTCGRENAAHRTGESV
jgi:hypothetical protein